MKGKNLLLLSNSTMAGDPYFYWPLKYFKEFFEKRHVHEVVFVPFAAVTFSYDEYEARLNKALGTIGMKAIGVHRFDNQKRAIEEAQGIAVGGGNTFKLLKNIYDNNLLEAIQEKVANGTPYSGWSAGSNVSTPSICTTNDMPIVEPPSFEALNLVDFQINPHYTNKTIQGHGGESRDTRLTEYTYANQQSHVAAIEEGCFIKAEEGKLSYHGSAPMRHFKYGQDVALYHEGDDISFLA